jgi:hypothetical protein
MDSCPDCFGKKERCGKIPLCEKCEYTESCRYCADNDSSKCDKTSGLVSYDRYSYSKDIADSPQDIGTDDAEEDSRESSTDDVRQIMEFLLDIDNYTAELLSAVLHDPQCTSASALARKFGIARQSMHRKLIDCCHQHPHLRKLFITRLTRCRRILTNSSRIEKRDSNKSNININNKYIQMELF